MSWHKESTWTPADPVSLCWWHGLHGGLLVSWTVVWAKMYCSWIKILEYFMKYSLELMQEHMYKRKFDPLRRTHRTFWLKVTESRLFLTLWTFLQRSPGICLEHQRCGPVKKKTGVCTAWIDRLVSEWETWGVQARNTLDVVIVALEKKKSWKSWKKEATLNAPQPDGCKA